MKLFVDTSLDAACNQYGGGKLNTESNSSGFEVRYKNGKVAGQNLLDDIKNGKLPVNIKNGRVTDSLDIVAHSMGFAYAQGMIEVLKGKIPLAGYYIIAPENACSGIANVNESDFKVIWQYGADETIDISKQDGVAPQCKVGGLDDAKRVYIPRDWRPQGFVSSHAIGNYWWIFNKSQGDQGYVKSR